MTTTLLLLTGVLAITLIGLIVVFFLQKQLKASHDAAQEFRISTREKLANLDQGWQLISQEKDKLNQLLAEHNKTQQAQREAFDAYQLKAMETLQSALQKNMQDIREQLTGTLKQQNQYVGAQVDKLTQQTQERLQAISGQVEKRLNEGFEKTTATFTDVVKRLAIIDQAQQKITDLSSNVVSLQEILSNKQSRGAFGEVQLASLVRDKIPEQHFAMQHQLSNSKRADCILFLPEPTGNIVIDAKFPLESYQLLVSSENNQTISSQFKSDIKKHINDIASKYILPPETTDSAMMFIPSEAVFAEIHANHQDLVDYSHQKRVWLTSPTTLMAILTTIRAVIKDDATKKQVHIIQEHLSKLAIDFSRFEERMNNLSRHIKQAHDDVNQVHISSKKITDHFYRIEKVELDSSEQPSILERELQDSGQ